jgi:hypothetical protein
MKALNFSLMILFIFALTSRVNTLDSLLQDVQMLLDTRNPNCVAYRDAVNTYIKAKFPDKMCQLQCNNADGIYAGELSSWYIPNFLPKEPKDCGTKVDDCNYKFDSKYIFGNKFYELLLDAEVFISVILQKSYLVLCK